MFPALLWVELSGHQVSLHDHAAKGHPILCCARYDRIVIGLSKVAMHEVEVGFIRYAIENGVLNVLFHLIPSYMGDLEVG